MAAVRLGLGQFVGRFRGTKKRAMRVKFPAEPLAALPSRLPIRSPIRPSTPCSLLDKVSRLADSRDELPGRAGESAAIEGLRDAGQPEGLPVPLTSTWRPRGRALCCSLVMSGG
jgi:hypothetical protein